MGRYIGLDVHTESTTLVVLGPGGKRVRREVLETRADVLIEAIRQVPGERHLILEEGLHSQWLHEVLSPHVKQCVVVQAVESRGQKSDEKDAWTLAEMLRTGRLGRQVFQKPQGFQELHNAVRIYRMTTADVTRAKNRLWATFASRGIRCDLEEVYEESTRARWVNELPESNRALAGLLGEELDRLQEIRKKARLELEGCAKHSQDVRLLKTAPGFGSIRAATVVATVVTPHRFRSSRQYWSYCGLGIVMRSSADWAQDPKGKWVRKPVWQTQGLNLNRNLALKEVYKSAAKTVVDQLPDSPFGMNYRRLVSGKTKPNLALLTTARQLASLTLAMWKKKEKYDPHRTHRPAEDATDKV